ncbi:MAG: hypothetical protein FWD53_02345 [Phycisphaerales bacterium]|nr:hypothetical protein [Phycisphaerales bacterium]
MDLQTKLAFGKLLGEIYRIQKRIEPGMCPVGDDTIYGLLHGIEPVIDDELPEPVTKEQVEHTEQVVGAIYEDANELETFSGFYKIEPALKKDGVGRITAIKIFTWYKADNIFLDVIQKCDTSNSPQECRKFELNEFDK